MLGTMHVPVHRPVLVVMAVMVLPAVRFQLERMAPTKQVIAVVLWVMVTLAVLFGWLKRC